MNTNCLAIHAIVWSLLVWSESTLSAEEPLTFTDAVERAVQLSPDIEAQNSARDAAQASAVYAGQLPNPELVIGIDNLPVTGADAGSYAHDFMTMRKIGVMQSFSRRAKRELRTQRASDAENLARVEQVGATLEVKRQTAQAWIATYIAEQTLLQLRILESEFELQSQIAIAALKSGRVTVADALESQAALLGFRDRIRIAEQNVRHTRAELARWLPEDATRPLASAPNFSQLSKAELLDNIHHHSSLAAYDAQLEAARTDIALAQAEKHPDWSVGLMYAKRGPDFSDMVSIEFRVGLPLFAARRQDSTIAAKRADLHKVEAQREAELRMHRAEVVQMIADWDTLNARATSFSTELIPLAKERARLAVTALQSGRGDVKSALGAQVGYAELQLQALDIEGQLGRTWAALNYLQADRSGP